MQDARTGERAAVVLGVDPGRCVGLAWVDAAGRLLRAGVVDGRVVAALKLDPRLVVALGDGTGSRTVAAALATTGARLVVVDERGTSEEGRRLYWRCTARGWWRMVPPGMRAPPRPIDDYAAYAIALRWLAARATDRAASETT